MSRLVVRRLAQLVPLLWVTGSLGFALVHLAPGDPVTALSGEFAHEDVQRELRERYGLDRSLPEQYVLYLSRLLRGDLGVSYFFQQPVAEVLTDRLPATLILVVPALVLSTLLGTAFGLLLAGRGPHRRKLGVVGAFAASNAVPVFWLAQMLLLVFAVRLDWFPVQGMVDPRSPTSLVDAGAHLVLPLSTLTLHQFALIAVLTFTGLERELREPYVQSARARGVTGRRVLLSHALPNALAPLIATVGGRVGALFTGAVLIETVFAWPGLGRLAVLASTNRDYPLVLGIFLLITTAVIVANVLTDAVQAAVDPRVRFE